MLEWKARIFTLLVSLGAVAEELWIQVSNNWNW